jgi:predicted porin
LPTTGIISGDRRRPKLVAFMPLQWRIRCESLAKWWHRNPLSSYRHPRKIDEARVSLSLNFSDNRKTAEGVMAVKRCMGLLLAGMGLGASCLTTAPAFAADMDTMVTKAPVVAPAAVLPPPTACGSIYDFFLTACQLTWYGVRFYGTVDVGGLYQTHGTPLDKNFPTGASYIVGAGGTGATNRTPGWGLAPNAMSQSNVGVEIKEPIAPGGWSFLARGELAFDPYSALLANAPQALQDAKGTAQNTEALPYDSSRWGWLNTNQYVGVGNPVWGTLTFGRQNTLQLDGINAYDAMGGAYAFSPIGYSGKAGGTGDTEDARWTTAIKYRVNIDWFRLGVMGQPIGGPNGGYNSYNPNNGAIAGDIGGDWRHLGYGTLSVDVVGTYERDAVNISVMYPGQALNIGGTPTTFPADGALKATLSNQTAVSVMAKYSFGSWAAAEAPIVTKEGPMYTKAPPVQTGVPLTLYAGYEWIQFTSPSDPQTTSFIDDGFTFNNSGGVNHGQVATANLTSINNNAFNANCGTGTGCSNEVFQVLWVGAKYGITRDLDIIGAYYEYWQNQYVNGAGICVNSGAHSQCAGTYQVYSAVLDWRFLPKWDTYAGVVYSIAEGGIANGDIQNNNLAGVAGVRFRF